MKKTIAMLLTAAVSASLLAGCGSSSQSSSQNTTTAQAGAETNSAADTQSGNSAKETPESSSEAADKAESNASYTIGIGQFAEHGSLDNCREGFLAGLAESGIQEGKNLTILYENSQADGGTASQIATNFAGKEVDLMCGIATPMAQAEYGVAKKSSTPVIFTAVTDPVAAELANADGTPVGEITGTSDKLPVEQQLKMIRAIVEQKDADRETLSICEINSGAYWFQADDLLNILNKIQNDNAQGEYYLPDAVKLLIKSGKKAAAHTTGEANTVLGANDCLQLNALNSIAREEVLSRHMKNGIEIPCRDGVMIGPDVKIGSDTCILPGTILRGKTVIGCGCTVGPNSFVSDCTVGDGVCLRFVQCENSVIKPNQAVAPFTVINH